MEKSVITTSEKPTLKLDIKGNLILKGWEELQVLVKSDTDGSLDIKQEGDEVSIYCQEDCTVNAPVGSTVICDRISGNATLKSLDGDLQAGEISGDLSLRGVGSVSIEQVRGNLTTKNISGDLHVDSVYGNVSVRDVQGDFMITDKVHGNLSLDDIDGNTQANADGNITLRLDPAPGSSHQISANGNLVCRIPPDASVEVEIPSAAKITASLPGMPQRVPIEAPYSLVLGDGDAKLVLSAGGNLLLGALSFDWGFKDFEVDIGEDIETVTEVINEQVTQQIDAQMEMLEQQLEAQLANLSAMIATSGLSAEKAERITERARATSERANARAQDKIRRVQEKLQRKLETARRRAEHRARASERAARDRRRRHVSFEWSPPKPEPPGVPTEPVSDEERLMVLDLLEQGKINIEEAEQLLSALEGKTTGTKP